MKTKTLKNIAVVFGLLVVLGFTLPLFAQEAAKPVLRPDGTPHVQEEPATQDNVPRWMGASWHTAAEHQPFEMSAKEFGQPAPGTLQVNFVSDKGLFKTVSLEAVNGVVSHKMLGVSKLDMMCTIEIHGTFDFDNGGRPFKFHFKKQEAHITHIRVCGLYRDDGSAKRELKNRKGARQ